MAEKAKGTGAGGCCCGGCRAVPVDSRASVGGLPDILPIQQYCCRCIPKKVCITVATYAGTQQAIVNRGCGTAEYDGDPIQYQTTVTISDVVYTLNVRLSVIYEECYITWDIEGLGLSGTRLIDPNEPADPYLCNHGMNAAACAQFGGEWVVDDPAMTITIAEPDTLDLKDLIECAGCNCLCRCLCISIYSRNAITGIFTLVGSNEVVCATLSRTTIDGCGNLEFYNAPWHAAWESHGWSISLGDQYDRRISTYTVNSGTESVSGTCSVADAIWKGDELEHTITGATAQVTYEWEIEHRIAVSMKWVGRSYDEASSIAFEAWNWTTVAWDTIGTTVTGRPVTTTINKFLTADLDAVYTRDGVDEGTVKIRLTVTGGTALHTDLLRITTAECCSFLLTPPDTVSLTSPPARRYLTGTEACPSPTPFWQMTEYDETEWFVSASCSWCGSTCGTVATACCPRPIGDVLFAEVVLECPTCAPATIVVPLVSDGTGAIWEGSVTVCSQTLTVTFSCSGYGWNINVTLDACTFAGDASSTECFPLSVDFVGTLGGGLGCCGPTGDPFATPTISITVIE